MIIFPLFLACILCLGAGWLICWWPRRERPGICPGCTHPLGCRSPFGACTRKIRVRNYMGGKRHGWKTEACGCQDHTGPSALDTLNELVRGEPA